MLGKGKKKLDASQLWVSPFGVHFPNPHKKSSYGFYHDTFCPETKSYEPKPDDKTLGSEGLLWKALSHTRVDSEARGLLPPCSGDLSSC